MKPESFLELLFIHFLPTVGFVLALLFLVHLLRSRRSPAATFAWLLAIIFVPYLGVPAYIFFGGRKMKRMTRMKPSLPEIDFSERENAPESEQKTQHDAEEVFPLRSNNKAEILVTGVDAYHQIIQLIQSARESIYIAVYVISKDASSQAILDALTEKAKAGVEVCLLLDAVGCMNIKKGDLVSLMKAGGKHAFFMPMVQLPFRGRANLRNHRKMIMVDRKRAIIGGRNLGNEYIGPEKDPKRWKDLSVLLEGAVIKDLFSIFYSDWKFAASEELAPWQAEQATSEQLGNLPVQLIPSGPDVSADYIQEAIIEALFSAKERFWIVTPYFVPNEMLTQSLAMAERRGVDVRLYIPKVSNHRLADLVRRTYLKELRKAGVRVLKYVPTMLHAKLVVIDDRMALTGSANMDLRSLFLNYEIGFMIHSEEVVRDLTAWIEGLQRDCVEDEDRSNVFEDLIEGMGRLLAPLI